jgi:N-acetylglucosaminyl-diphospho-decaprenol L-rhamnosyltransferase
VHHVRAVVVCFDNRDLLPRCLDHLLGTRLAGGELSVVVVDNASSDGSVDDWEARYPTVRLVRNATNLGFAGGVNSALQNLDGVDAVALVNSDAFVEPDWLQPLVDALAADASVGAAQSKIVFAEPDDEGRPRINSVGVYLGPTWELHDRGYGEVDSGQYDGEEDIWGWSGGAVLLRRAYLDDVGLFDERLFMYAEDADLSWRGARRGWRYRYVPTSVVRHVHRASSGGERTPLLDHLNRRNRLVVVTRHGGWRGATIAWTRALGGIAVAVPRDLVAPLLRGRRPRTAELRRRIRAAWDAARLLAGGSPRLPAT